VKARNKFLILLSIIAVIAATYYWISTDHTKDMILIGTVDSNQVVVSPQVQGRIQRLLVEEGTQVKAGDLIAILDPSELEAQERAAAATIASLRSRVSETQYTERSMKGSTKSDVVNAQARLQSARAQLLQAEAMLQRVESDSRRMIQLAKQGVASEQESVQAEANLNAQQAAVQALKEQVAASQADLDAAVARTHQASAAQSVVATSRAQVTNAEAQLKEAEVRLGYTKIYAPVTGTVSVRAAREGEVVGPGSPIVTIVDLGDTWVRAAIPETASDHIGLGDTLRVRLPGGTITTGKVFFKAVEADFATQRDVSRRKRDIKAIVLKVAVDNSQKTLVPGMTAEIMVPKAKAEGQ
jgi:HlyD family secretion protein